MLSLAAPEPRLLQREIERMEAAIAECVALSDDLRSRAALLRSAPGLGPVSATALLAEMPELATLTPRQAGALAGLAPMARESGVRVGKRRIGGGRKGLRDVLYMAGLSAARNDPALRAFWGKTPRTGQSAQAGHHRGDAKIAGHSQRHDPGKQAVSAELNNTLARGPGQSPGFESPPQRVRKL